jgi:thiol-disulfide isomerase/thioredoxin
LKELQEYYAKEKLTDRHLRMASSTVALINRLEDGDQREEHFVSFGNAFAKAGDKELARYGKKLAKKPGAVESDLVGKPLELAGTTAKGADFVWDAYRGKVVIVDFWATWCGPCIREMPNVKAFYEKQVDRGFDIVGISLDKDQEALAQYLEENRIAWDTLAGDDTQELASKYGVRGIPTMMLVDREGKVVAVAHNLAALAPQAEKLLAAPAAK